MSLKNHYRVDCPSCGHRFTVLLWDSVNTAINPEVWELFEQGSFNVAFCPHCGEGFFVEKEVLFHFMRSGVMVLVVPDALKASDRYRDPFSEVKRIEEQFGPLMEGYEYRVMGWSDFIAHLEEFMEMEASCTEAVWLIWKALEDWPDSLIRDRGINGAEEIDGIRGVWLRLDSDDPDFQEIFMADDELYWKTLKEKQ